VSVHAEEIICLRSGFVDKALNLGSLSGVIPYEPPDHTVVIDIKEKKSCDANKQHRSNIKLVCGEYVWVEQTLEFSGKALMRKFHGKYISEKTLNSWIHEVWSFVIQYGLVFHLPIIR
jgi:hypothetical protein